MMAKGLPYFFSLLLLALCWWPTMGFSFPSIATKRMVNSYAREEISWASGLFYPGTDWAKSVEMINSSSGNYVWATEQKLRFEKYRYKSFDFRFGGNFQRIDSLNLNYQALMLAVDLINNLYALHRHNIYTVATFGWSPRSQMKVYHPDINEPDWTLYGITRHVQLNVDWTYQFSQSWSVKTEAGYLYQKLSGWDKSPKFDPNQMVIQGPILSFGLSYRL
ncbi:MAG: hypothetical protein WCG27_10570 [Pseudomonadota bacterium]